MVSNGSAARRPVRGGTRAGVAAALHALVAVGVRRRPRSLSLTSLSTLATLDSTGPRRVTELAATEGVSQPSMTALIAPLERSGLVERRSDHADKRVALIALTATGLEYLQSERRAGAETFVPLIDGLTAAETRALIAALPALRHLRQLAEEERAPLTKGSNRHEQRSAHSELSG